MPHREEFPSPAGRFTPMELLLEYSLLVLVLGCSFVFFALFKLLAMSANQRVINAAWSSQHADHSFLPGQERC